MFAVVPGTYQVGLSTLPDCRVTSANFVSVTIAAETVTDIAFSVTCDLTGTIEVTVATTGTGAPASYAIGATDFWENFYYTPIPSSGTASLVVPASLWDYRVGLGVPVNCTVTGSPWSVTVASGATTSITFNVTCEPPATLRVTASTTGSNVPATFTVDVDPTISGSWTYRMIVSSNGADSTILRPGSHTVKLLAPLNCFVGPNDVSVTLTSGTTTDLGFTVACQ